MHSPWVRKESDMTERLNSNKGPNVLSESLRQSFKSFITYSISIFISVFLFVFGFYSVVLVSAI